MRGARIERKTAEQLCAMRVAGLVVARTLGRLRAEAGAGVTTAHLDLIARDEIARAGAVSSFLGYDAGYGLPPFPGVTCISVNSEVVHGIPGDRVLSDGDLVSIDFGVSVDGWHGDSAITFAVGASSPDRLRLSEVTC
ncbi:MAG: M24 family metallopeptidase, partial [Propionicimonas sp.]|nr:M24 family metallopeptidase [Propionicimonas sp.]